MGPDERIYRIGSRQLGLVTTAQIAAAGLSKNDVVVRQRRFQLVGIRRGVYRLAGAPATWEREVLAAVLVAPPVAVASHVTAGALWCPTILARAKGTIHVTSCAQARLAGVQVHRRELANWQRTEWDGIPVTRPECTVADLAGTVDQAVLEACADDLLRRRLLSLERLRDLAATRVGSPGAPALRRLLADRLPGYRAPDSDWEKRMDALYDRLGLPPAVRQYRIRTANGTYRVDRAIVELQIAIEWNGYRWHGQRRPFDADSDRAADVAAAGWQLLGFTDKTSPERLRAAVWGAVAERESRSSRPPTGTAVV
ncbi:MAG TPA: type IV toxin-antitoxin system AbiEi family antitoxin domain-containing protein [Acidimicrobiales bacterium]|jgi:very-short-patch-repair endonuclease|nr:type IV toxin-antitoxin system AbiEi family antitoxin domain-containing protein [Acidimicrobiales bacterium]